MYSILIVDDERYMRDGIAKVLPWDRLNIDRVDTAESGTKALQKMDAHMPDIVLTDIEMDNMDGLMLIKEMNQRNPLLRIIVLTGHDDFSYVQECCRMEVHDYLLKPIDDKQLSQAIHAQIQAIEKQTREQAQQRTMEFVNGLAEQRKVEQAFQSFLKHPENTEQIGMILDDYGYQSGEGFQAAIIVPASMVKNEWSNRHELLDLSMKSVCIEQIEYHRHGITFRDENGLLVVLLFCGPDHPDAVEQVEQLQTILQNEYEQTQKVYLGSVADRLGNIPDSYRVALRLWKNSVRSQCIVQAPQKEDLAGRLQDMMQSFRQELGSSLGNQELALQTFEACWEELRACQLPLTSLRQNCLHLLSDTYFLWMKETGGSVNQSLTDLLVQLQSADEGDIYRISQTFLEQLLEDGKNKDEDVIDSAKRYINQHLDEPLSVTQLAGKFYLSIAYFSKLFKKAEGVGCSYYIMCQRMERAKELLKRSALRVREVSEQVGYKDVNYFSLTFKKYAGLAPAEYREQR